MSGETETNISGWTVDTLKEYLESKITAVKENAVLALTASEKAVQKAEVAADKRFDAVNEFRAQLSDQAGLFMPRAEYDARHQALEALVVREREDIAEIRKELAALAGAATGKATFVADRRALVAVLAAVASVLVAIIAVVVIVVLAV